MRRGQILPVDRGGHETSPLIHWVSQPCQNHSLEIYFHNKEIKMGLDTWVLRKAIWKQ